jgi:carbon-monoxide dehydrogenase catalytic subunit
MKIPTVEDILKKFACHTVMNIHIKQDSEYLYRLVDLIKKYDCEKYVYFMTGDDRVLEAALRVAPHITRCAGAGNDKWAIVERALKYDCKKVQFFTTFINQQMIDKAKAVGAKGITISGVCCTSNEVTMRRGIPMAGNFLQQEAVVLTGACEAIVVDVQCIFPALGPLSKCFHTKFITTSYIAQMPESEFIPFSPETAGRDAKRIVEMAIENFKNRKPELVHIPDQKQKATVGYSFEEIIKKLDGVTNSFVDKTGTTLPLVDCVKSGVIRGAVAMVGCNNPKVRPDVAHIGLMKKFLENDIIVITTGCSAQAAAKAGLMDKRAKDICGAGLKRVCELADIPPVLHMGSCVDISRMMILAAEIAKDSGWKISEIPVLGCAPEWMSEKAVSIGNYVVATGIDTYLGVEPYATGSEEVDKLLKGGLRDWVEAAFTVESDIDKLGDIMVEAIEKKREALGI